MKSIRLTIHPNPPFRLDFTVWVLRRRPVNRIDLYDGRTYSRAVLIDGAPALLEVEQTRAADVPQLTARIRGDNLAADAGQSATRILTDMLALDRDISGFYALAENDSNLAALVNPFSGMRPPRFSTLFEAVANGIIAQQISLYAAMSILSRFAEVYGKPVCHDGRAFFAFPEAADLAGRNLEEIQKAGLTSNKARALREAARVIADGALTRDQLEPLGNEEAANRLKELRGIGSWTADYILLRALGRLDIFPGKDSGALKSLNKWLNPDIAISFSTLESIVSSWYPYQGLVYFHLLLKGLAEERLIT